MAATAGWTGAVLGAIEVGEFRVDIQGWDSAVVLVTAFTALIVLFSVGLPMLASFFSRRARERTKREIAAYVAEGSIPPEAGEKLMRAASSEASSAGAARDRLEVIGAAREASEAGGGAGTGRREPEAEPEPTTRAERRGFPGCMRTRAGRPMGRARG